MNSQLPAEKALQVSRMVYREQRAQGGRSADAQEVEEKAGVEMTVIASNERLEVGSLKLEDVAGKMEWRTRKKR